MPSTLSAKFDTRREAEMTIERLVQEFNVERTDIFVTSDGDENSAGTKTDGSDEEAGSPTPEARDDAALTSRIVVSVDIQDAQKISKIREAFGEFGGV